MIRGKLGWSSSLKIISAILSCLFFTLTLASILTQQVKPAIIILAFITVFSIILTLYLFIYKICVYEDKIKIVNMFKTKEYYYSNIIIKSDISITISDINNNELLRIASFLDPNLIIIKWYSSYCKKNKIKFDLDNKKMKFNFYVKNFSIFGCIFSVLMLLFFLFSIYLEKKELLDDLNIKYFFLVFSIIVMIPSLYALLLYYNFEILLSDDSLVLKNFLGFKKKYKISDIQCEYREKIIKIKLPSKRKILLLYYFLDNRDMLLFISKNKY